MEKQPLVSVLMPVYNGRDYLRPAIESVLNQTFTDLELLIINDGSKDGTKQILDRIAPSIDNLYVVHQPNGGHGNAAVNGYRKAVELNSEWVFQTDSDDQFVTEDVIKLWAKRNESNFIMGYRQVRFDAPARLVITRILKYTIFFAYGTFINDANIPFRLIKGSYLKKLLAQLPNPEPFAPNIFLAVMAKKAGEKTFDIPITHKERLTGTVSILRWKLIKVCIQSFKELLNFRLALNSKVRAIKAS